MYLAYIPSFSVMHLGNSLNSILVMVKDVWNHLCKLISNFFCSQRRFDMYDHNDASEKATVTIFNSYTMGTSGLPDIYTRGPQARGLRVYISGEPRVHMV